MKFVRNWYQDLFGSLEQDYGRWFVRICMILIANLVLTMIIFMAMLESARSSSQYQDPSGFWYSYSLIGMTLGFIALGFWGGWWLIRVDKILFCLVLSYLVLGQKAQEVRNERFNSSYDTSTNVWEYFVMMLLAVAAIRIWVLWRRSQNRQELARVLDEARIEPDDNAGTDLT